MTFLLVISVLLASCADPLYGIDPSDSIGQSEASEETDEGYTLAVLEECRDLLYEDPSGRKYDAGESVVIKTHIIYDADIECYINGKSIGRYTVIETDGKYTHWEFYFEMPEENVTVELKIVGSKSG